MPERVGYAPPSTWLSAVYSEFMKRTVCRDRNFYPMRPGGVRDAPIQALFWLEWE